MIDRWGFQRTISTALITIATGALLTTQMTAPWQLVLLWGVVVGIGTGSMATVLAATVVNRWFFARRGVVLGLLTPASATGQLVFLPGMAWLATHNGRRAVSLTVACGALAVVPLVALFMRDRPADLGLRRYGAGESDTPPTRAGNPIRAAFSGLTLASGSTDFWLLAATFFVCGASTNGLIGTHLIPAAMDHGMAEVAAASLLATVGIFDVIGTTASGWLTDRVNPRRLLFAYYGLRGLSLLVLPWAFDSPNFGLILFIVFYGLDWVATVPPTVALTSDVFGKERAPIVYGWVFAAHQVGAAAAAYGAGAMREEFGDYLVAFTIAGALCLVAAGMSLQINRDRSRAAGGGFGRRRRGIVPRPDPVGAD
jgi:sugar phosphate permease